MNTQHTPGPWKYRPEERLIWTKTGDGLLSNLHIAKVCAQAEETEANARLIAAAPELLEALQMFFTSVHTCNYCDGSGTDESGNDTCHACHGFGLETSGDTLEAYHEARAAIAKATGETI